ncbi:hypothetical protein FQR65_LT13621 [Abscondita terminalis]|nr:hypothetical protein FQR65_LT13621 [Abscondita terminalis]
MFFLPRYYVVFSVVTHLVSCQHLPPEAVEEWTKLISPFENECAPKETKPHEEVDGIIKEAHVEKSLETCLYLKCLYEKLNFFGPNGEIMGNVVMEKLNYMTPNITKICVDEAAWEIGRCKKSYAFGNCVIRVFAY